MTPVTIFLVVLLMFTTAGPTQRTMPAEDFATCQALALAAGPTLTGRKIPLQTEPAPAPPESVLILDAQAKCLVFNKQDHASSTRTDADGAG